MTTIYFAGGEDSDFNNVAGMAISTTSTTFRSAFARCSLGSSTSGYWQTTLTLSLITFWASMRMCASSATTNTNCLWFGFVDSNNLVRLRIRSTANVAMPTTIQVEKLDAAGTVTSLTTFTVNSIASNAGNPDKFDLFVNYGASGQMILYQNGVQLFNFSGDLTTSGLTSFAGMRFSGVSSGSNQSEIIISDTDTRSMSLQTLAPAANGNTHNFDTGTPAAANVNETTLSDATLDGSTTAGQIDQYTIPSLASGSYSILAVGISARMQKGASGPSKMDLGVRSGGTDYWSADQSLTVAWADYQNWWTTDPNTSSAWTALPSNIGLKSVT